MNSKNFSEITQMIESVEDATDKLEEAYEKKDYEKFNSLKKFILQLQQRIGENI